MDQSNAIAVGLGALVGGYAFEALGSAILLFVFALAEFGAVTLLMAKVKEPQVREA